MVIENTLSSDFDPGSSIVKSVFDRRLPGVLIVLDIIEDWFSHCTDQLLS